MADSVHTFPTRVGPDKGVNAFSPLGERQIYELVRTHEVKVAEVAFRCETTHATVYSILNRVQARIDAGEEPREFDESFYAAEKPEPKVTSW